MLLDSLTLYGLAKEMKESLLFSQVRQIHQTDPRIIDIECFRPGNAPIHLVLSARTPPYAYITPKTGRPGSYTPSQTFCMTLRKHLEGSRLSSIEQIHMDRILCFHFDRIESGGEIITKSLYAELIPSAPNLVLTEGDIVIDACIHGKKLQRVLIPQSPYKLPDNTDRMNFMQFSWEELKNIIDYGQDSAQILPEWMFTRFNGFSRLLTEEICFRCGIAPNTPVYQLTSEKREQWASAVAAVATEAANSSGLYVYRRSDKKEQVSIIPFKGIQTAPEYCPSVSQWILRTVENCGGFLAGPTQELKKRLASLIKKEERKAAKIQKELSETDDMDRYKRWGELLTIYAWQKPEISTEIIVDNLLIDPPVLETIPLQPGYSLSANSQFYFKKYSKLKTRLAMGAEKLADCQQNLEYLKNMSYFLEQTADRKELTSLAEELRESGLERNIQDRPRKKSAAKTALSHEPEIFHIDGYTVYAGRNSQQNEYLTCKKARGDDLWFHAQKIPGSHVVVASDGSPWTDSIIEKAASLAAWMSQGKQSGRVAVDYTPIRYVKKIHGAPAGLVNYTHQKTIIAVPILPSKNESAK